MLAVKEQAKQGVPVQAIELAPLGVPEVAEFVADTLHQDAATAMPLAEVIQQKTGGNPFFMRQFLQALYGAQLITFDSASEALPLRRRGRQERCDHGERRRAAGDEAAALAREHAATLRVAAVIGSRFELRLLANVQQQSAAATNESLRPAIEAGLIAPLTGLESVDADALQSPLVYGRFAFRHDRVQQAAYATLPESERPRLHLAIGRAWLAMTPAAELESRLFDIVGHLNEGRALHRRRRGAAAARRSQPARRHQGARRDGVRSRRQQLPHGDRARRRERVARPLRACSSTRIGGSRKRSA